MDYIILIIAGIAGIILGRYLAKRRVTKKLNLPLPTDEDEFSTSTIKN